MQDVNAEIVLESLIYMTDGVASVIGDKGARAVMRQAGHRAAIHLLEALPLRVSVLEAIARVGPVLQELGFVEDVRALDSNHVVVEGNLISRTLRELASGPGGSKQEPSGQMARHPARYYVFGLFEGMILVLSETRIAVVRDEMLETHEVWTIQREEQ